MFDLDYNAYIDVWQPFRQRNSSSSSCPPLGPGAHSFEFFTVLENDHVPGAGSALIDTGHDGLVGSTPWFPVPEGGGRRIDFGAYEYGAGSWPYDFQVIAAVTKDPVSETIRVGETNDWMKSGSDALASNGGWGIWSVGFYRFVVGAGTLEPPENLRLVE
jgi:hypothetical protein